MSCSYTPATDIIDLILCCDATIREALLSKWWNLPESVQVVRLFTSSPNLFFLKTDLTPSEVLHMIILITPAIGKFPLNAQWPTCRSLINRATIR